MDEYQSIHVATAQLKAEGLKLNFSSGGRAYYWRGDGTDRMVDHSATLTKCGNTFIVCWYL